MVLLVLDPVSLQAGRDVEAAGHGGVRPPAGAHHHALHRLPRPHLLLLRGLHGREGLQRELRQLRPRALVHSLFVNTTRMLNT